MDNSQILKDAGLVYTDGYLRFLRRDGMLNPFQFHVRDIRSIVIIRGEGLNRANNEPVTVVLARIEIAGGGNVDFGVCPPEDMKELEPAIDTLLELRDEVCGLPKAEYLIEIEDTIFYINKPVVNWPVQETPAE